MVREMIKIGNFVIPGSTPIRVGLSYIYGVGTGRGPEAVANKILQRAKVDPLIKGKYLNDEQKAIINQELKKFAIEEELKKKIEQNIKDKIDIRCRQGVLHSMKKKVRGQSTRRNNRIRPNGIVSMKKIRETVAGKKKAPKQG